MELEGATTTTVTLRGQHVVLRSPRPDDVSSRLRLGQDPEIMRMFGADPTSLLPLTEAETERWIDGLIRHTHAWIVEHDGQLLGEIRLDGVDMHDRRARLAIGLYDQKQLGMGLGREAVRLMLSYAFDSLKLHRVGLRVISYNERAIRCYQACGFVVEGREREAALVGKKRHDDVIMGVLAYEFRRST